MQKMMSSLGENIFWLNDLFNIHIDLKNPVSIGLCSVEQQLCHKGLFSEMWSLEEMLEMFVLLSFFVLRRTFICLQPNLALHVKCSEPNSYQRRALKFSILSLISELEATFIVIMLFK